ncbi:molybdopterin-dependent oxidoreductase [Adlercreutzia sp. ZJ242]|uniref:molybdopterin-containing oxidoreductase family protein n=1 Tax=Adlercreutzia sp. ZJ242 TaxID=2709409 RepID=UPI0013ECB75C|nr:molybdopterin-dependent oxidoreductase [Adlercreutzia sp. ZJ242]
MAQTENRWAPAAGQLERVQAEIVAKHDGDEIMYASCSQNGCFDGCPLRVHMRDGRCISIETDNTIHPNKGREDAYMTEEEVYQGMYQKRACTRGRGVRGDIQTESRILYPMRRVGPKGTLEFERISWDEATTIIAEKILEAREKYGPLSVYGDGMLQSSFDPFSKYLPGGGIACWGEDSYEPHNFADSMTFGQGNDLASFYNGSANGNVENQSYLDAKMILFFGFDPAINYTEQIYYILLAKEKGIPVIVIDPRFTWTAQALATQYIPIRPDTDKAMILAMCHTLFEEDIYDHEFVEEWVEPTGLEKFRQYVMGETYDEQPKTPEWAEVICGVPAETIRELTRMMADNQPCFCRMVWAVGRKIYGKDAPRLINYLNSLTGNIGKKGTAGMSCAHGSGAGDPMPSPYVYLGSAMPAPYQDTVCMEAERFSAAINNRRKMEAGEMTMEEYKASIGCPSDAEAPNIKVIHLLNMVRTFPTGWYDSNDRIKALMDPDVFFIVGHWNWQNPNLRYADIVLPYASHFLEGIKWTTSTADTGSHGWSPAYGCMNYFAYYNATCTPPGEAKHPILAMRLIAKKLGIGDMWAPFLGDAETTEEFNAAIDQIAEGTYNHWRTNTPGVIERLNPPESWTEFKKEPICRWPMNDYWVWREREIKEKIPFNTPSGKIEFYCDFLADADLKKSVHHIGQKTFGGSGRIDPMAKYRVSPTSMFSARVNKYPLNLLTPHSFYRHHTGLDGVKWFRDEFRNSVWLSASDAKRRGIKDNDLVRVFNDAGEIVVPAYVTSRMTPGVTCVIFGRWQEHTKHKTELSPQGVDTRGNCNFLIKDEFYDDILGALLCSDLVEIEKVEYTEIDAPKELMMEVK